MFLLPQRTGKHEDVIYKFPGDGGFKICTFNLNGVKAERGYWC